MGEMVLGANAPVWMYAAGPPFAGVVYNNGNERDKRVAELMVERQWPCTMVLTEPDAGSDVGAGRTKATPNEDGSWNVTGVKRFITSAEGGLSDNTMHLVLARPEGVEGAGGPGTKGLSLFWMPTYHFDHETGELTGERNGVYVTNVEHKMGIKVSNTCEVTFGDPQVGGGEPAKGWLLGEVHNGIAQMFDVIENARMMVGTKAIATLSTGYLNALEYAKERVQGADLTQAADKTAPRVTITHHPDVRRSLMTQKSFAEAMRALVLYTASWQDQVMIAEHDRREGRAGRRGQRPAAADREGLRLGAFVGAAGHRVAADLRRVGLPAGVPDRAVRPRRQDRHPLRGHHGDPGPGLLLPQDRQGPGPRAGPPGEGDRDASSPARPATVASRWSVALLATALEDANAIVGHMINDLMSADASAEGGDLRNIYKVGLNTSRLLMALGDVVCGWLLLRQAEVALAEARAGTRARTRRSTRARWPPRSSSRRPTCPASPPSAPSPRASTSR